MQFSSLKLIRIRGVRDHIMRMRDIATQLKRLKLDMFESFLVHFIACTLSSQYGPFKISYNTHNEKWLINKHMTTCVQDEGCLAMEEGEKVNIIVEFEGNNMKYQTMHKGKEKIHAQKDIKKDNKHFYFFCKKKGHMKKNCHKYFK